MRKQCLCWLGAWLLGPLSAGPVLADPGYYLLTPYSTPGVLSLDLRYWTVKAPGKPTVLWPELGLRYGINSRWTTGLLASYIGESLGAQRLSSLNWQNSILLTQGESAVDLAIHAQLIHNQGRGNTLELGPLLQWEIGLTQLNANLVFEHDWSRQQGTRIKIQWQALHRLAPGLRLGLQGFGELGRWDDWSHNQSHRAGPVLRLRLADRLDLQAAYLWGKTYGTHGDMFSTQLTLAF